MVLKIFNEIYYASVYGGGGYTTQGFNSGENHFL